MEENREVYSIYVRGERVLYAPDFETPREAMDWLNSQSDDWDEGIPRIEKVYNY